MNPDFGSSRRKMVDGQLRTSDVNTAAILDAMDEVPREAFVGAARKSLAYIDEDIEVAPASSSSPARFLMEPAPFARMLQLADIGRGDFVLDIGCASGYSAAVISRIAGSVIALESDAALGDLAGSVLSSLGYDNVVVVEAPLALGYAAEAPYDVIVLEGAVDIIPAALFEQLREGGRLVAVEGRGNAGVARVYLKAGGTVSGRRGFNAAVKPLPGFEKTPAFEF
ncbi:MAG: protein-L-isoaspartate O-methyltransferase [Rhizobiaceae bacterium]